MCCEHSWKMFMFKLILLNKKASKYRNINPDILRLDYL